MLHITIVEEGWRPAAIARQERAGPQIRVETSSGDDNDLLLLLMVIFI